MNEQIMYLIAAVLVLATMLLTIAVTNKYFILIPKGDKEGKEIYLMIKAHLFDGTDTNDIVFVLIKTYNIPAHSTYACILAARDNDLEYFTYSKYLDL